MAFIQDITMGSVVKLTAEQKRKASEEIEKCHKEDSRAVKGVFKNIECPGGDLEFAIRLYRGDPIRKYHLIDGESYTIPFGVAKHINRQCKYKKSTHLIDTNGRPIVGAGNPIDRYQFVSQDYM